MAAIGKSLASKSVCNTASIYGNRLAPVKTGARSSRSCRSMSSRAAVVVEANLFARMSRLVRGVTENVVTTAEDPEKLLDTVVMEMQSDLMKMNQAAAQVMSSQKQLETKYKQAQAVADDWLRRAELAVQKGEDELAKEALVRRKTYQAQADSLNMQLKLQQKAVNQLVDNTRLLEAKLLEAKNKKDTLKARAASAKTSQQIQEMLGSMNTSNAVVAFEKMEAKVMALEAEAESTAILVGGDKLEDRFALLESGTVEDELSALKKGMLKEAQAPVAALPAGRPIAEVFDTDVSINMELEMLRSRARA